PPHARVARACDRGRAALAHRRQHASRPRAGRRVGLSRRAAADEGARRPPRPREGSGAVVTLSLSEISTVGASFEEDVRAYAAAGFDGIGIWEEEIRDEA